MTRMKLISISMWVITVALPLTAVAAADRFPPYDGTAEREAFWELYNKRVLADLQAQAKELPEQIAKETDPVAKADLEKALENLTERLKKPEFFTFATSEDIPKDLKWEDGLDQPEVGDDRAIKGGTHTTTIPSFPATLRIMGENSNGSFRSAHYDDVELGLILLHPETGEPIPGIAKQWAVAPDNRTVFYRIDEAATYSDGVPVEADDFFNTFYMQLSEYAKNPFGNQWYSTTYTNITRYDAKTLSITLAEPKVLAPYYTSLTPFPRHYYQEFGPDFEQRYQWRGRPTTGAYEIKDEDVVFGRSITLTRVKNWWAKDRKFYKNRFNVDRIVYRVVRLQEKTFELFRQGAVDAIGLDLPEYWYERAEIPEVHHGYIHKAKFYNLWPSSSAGLYLNTAKPLLKDLDVRIGINYAINYQKVIDFDLRGDFRRLNAFSEGYPLLGNPPITARPFSPQKAREHFAKAGFTKTGPGGVLMRENGERLSMTISHRKSPVIDKYMQRLKEEAIKCGLELKLESMDSTAYFQKATQKQHDAVQVAWGTTPPFPDHYQHFHSKDAYMPDGKTPRPNTNNLTSFAHPEMDRFAEAERSATSVEEFRQAVFGADQIIYDQAIWVPGFDSNFYRVGYWRWVKWPEKTFNVSISQDAFQNHVLWIDEKVKEETLEAMRKGEKFPEVERVYDQNLHQGGSGESKEMQKQTQKQHEEGAQP
jgi:microcin C transport system substrate-binding protein